MINNVDLVKLNFSPQTLAVINGILGVIMFGVALDLHFSDFVDVFKKARAPLIGLLGQFILLPAFTYLLILIIRPIPSIALGMLLVAACPGGNISNFITYLAKGNVSLSISMTAISTLLAIFMTPLNLYVWSMLNPQTAALYHTVKVDPVQMLELIFVILGIPLVSGMFIAKKFPLFAQKVQKPFKISSIVVFILIVILAIKANWQFIPVYMKVVAFVVIIHNATALTVGYLAARVAGLEYRDRKAVSIEVGIQNSALGLVLIFNFFNGLGGMALVAAWWGVWHIISGLSLAGYWSWRATKLETV